MCVTLPVSCLPEGQLELKMQRVIDEGGTVANTKY